MSTPKVPQPEAPAAGETPANCRRCELWRRAVQAVDGEGPPGALVMLVGEQPGDEEDRQGHPFVGPAGRLLDDMIAEAGLDRKALYITNAVKHFKWEPRGKRRLHKKPLISEVNACRVWLDREIASREPRVIVALGATALRALCGGSLSILEARAQTLTLPSGARLLASYHPSAILRAEGQSKRGLRALIVADLRRAGELSAGA